jgi:serine protease AprX
MKKIISLLLWGACVCNLAAQSGAGSAHYWVFFADKPCSVLPTADFAPQAIARRTQMGIPFPTIEDYPVDPNYQAAVAQIVSAQRHTLRWFNAMTVTATPSQMEAVSKLPFVKGVAPMAVWEVALASDDVADDAAVASEDSTMLHTLFTNQRELVHLQALEDAGLTGKGMRIAVFDAGFSGADTHIAFAQLHKNGQIKATKDFVGGDDKVYAHSNHGTAVLSCIAGYYEGKRIGAAVDAEFLLARTERNLREPVSEEDNWMAAMEWADLNGADIISSSLGYTKSRYTYADMTGSKTLVSRAAAMAVRKGMLVVNSAGNEGRSDFHYLGAPADADSVLTVGGSYPMFAYRMPFSSFGPNARGVLKPEISGPGYMLAANKKGGYKPIGGTSFACPMVAGIAACAMQRWPDETNMQIKGRIMAAGNTYPYFDYALGYGVLDAAKLLQDGPTSGRPTFQVEMVHDTLWVTIDPRAMALDSAKYKNGKPFSYHFVKTDGQLSNYKTYVLQQKNLKFGLPLSERKEGVLEIWFQGYLWKEE